jgi:hypothetical protein
MMKIQNIWRGSGKISKQAEGTIKFNLEMKPA